MDSLAREALRKASGAGTPLSASAGGGLPWGVFLLLSGDPEQACRTLKEFQRVHGPTAAAYLALGEACRDAGRPGEAERAWREGYGLDPAGRSWGPEPEWVTVLREDFAADEVFAGDWWAAGAYLDGRLPRYGRTGVDLVARRLRRFRDADASETGTTSAPVLFFSGLFLSEHGDRLPDGDLARVRRTLRRLHPEAFALHMEVLREQGPPADFGGGEYLAW